jgi:hypothetical protein
MDERTIKELSLLLGINVEEESVTVDSIGNWFSQITTVLLIVFMIAYVLFTGAAKAAIREAENQVKEAREQTKEAEKKVDYWSGKYKDINDSDVTREREMRIVALIDLQKERLIVELEKINFQERKDFGIVTFGPKEINGRMEYGMSEILSGAKVISRLFKDSCVNAKEGLSDQKNMRQEWYEMVLQNAGVVQEAEYNSNKDVNDYSRILTPENAQWLVQEIRSRIEAIDLECRDIQYKAISYLSEYYASHPSDLKDTNIDKQLKSLVDSPIEERETIVMSFSNELQKKINSLFENQGIPLLSSIQ